MSLLAKACIADAARPSSALPFANWIKLKPLPTVKSRYQLSPGFLTAYCISSIVVTAPGTTSACTLRSTRLPCLDLATRFRPAWILFESSCSFRRQLVMNGSTLSELRLSMQKNRRRGLKSPTVYQSLCSSYTCRASSLMGHHLRSYLRHSAYLSAFPTYVKLTAHFALFATVSLISHSPSLESHYMIFGEAGKVSSPLHLFEGKIPRFMGSRDVLHAGFTALWRWRM